MSEGNYGCCVLWTVSKACDWKEQRGTGGLGLMAWSLRDVPAPGILPMVRSGGSAALPGTAPSTQ
jgi:hypothetical protein